MENNAIKDRSLGTLDKSSDIRARVVGIVESVEEKIGTFVLSDKTIKITCLPPVNASSPPKKGELITLVGRVMPTDNGEIEIRTESFEKISEKDYDSYNKYLKLRNDLIK